MSLGLIDAMPLAPDDLAGYFRSLELEDLGRCWVACVVSASIEWEWNKVEVAAFDAAVKVVAERLHGVNFGGIMGKATPIDANERVKRAPEILARYAGEIEVVVGDAPEPGGSKQNPRLGAALAKLGKAPVGAWIVVPEDVAKYRGVAAVLAGLHRRGRSKDLEAYRDGAGRTVVKKGK